MLDGVKYPKLIPLFQNKKIDFECLRTIQSTKKKKTILLWNTHYGAPLSDHYAFGHSEQFSKSNCPITDCELTKDRSALSRSDLVLFHLRNKIDFIPRREFSTQRFVHVVYESPVNCHLCDKFNGSVFNYSASFRIDSDYSSIYWTNSGLYWEVNETFNESHDYSENKSDLVAALISNCEFQSSMRNEYIARLRNVSAEVKVYGKCGIKCEAKKDCLEFIAKRFKFILAFENSLCSQYITEKFFNWLNYDIVPVVLGAGDYSHFVPKSAYINALDFESPADLGSYLKYLDRNATAYNELFKWKKFVKSNYFAKPIRSGFLCEMCIQLHLEEKLGLVKQKQLVDLKSQFGLFENCFQAEIAQDTG